MVIKEQILQGSLPEEIIEECMLVFDLLEVSIEKPQLNKVALLVATMTLEKTLRIVLYHEYKTITKIKFSVLIDKAQQLGYTSKETASQLRELKNNRNAHAHNALIVVDTEKELMTIPSIMECIYTIFEKYYLLFPPAEETANN